LAHTYADLVPQTRVQAADTPLAKSALVRYIQMMNHIYNRRYSAIVVLHVTRQVLVVNAKRCQCATARF
jgi:hypothetical protein